MVKVERELKVELPQGEFLKALSENNSSGKFIKAREERKLADIGEIRNGTPHRIVVGSQSTITEIFPQGVFEKATDVFSVSMSQSEFITQVVWTRIKGVLDIGHVDKHNGVSRTVIGSAGQIQVIFPNIELPLNTAK